jgi:hypothetical protein
MGMGVGLVALALGYLVYVSAMKEKGGIKVLGQAIGLVVMIAATFCFACSMMKCASKAGCPIFPKCDKSMSGKMTCPVHAGMTTTDKATS